MRVVRTLEDLEEHLDSAQREAENAFGNGTCGAVFFFRFPSDVSWLVQAPSFWRSFWTSPGTLRCRFSAMSTATSCTSLNVTAASSAVTRKSLRLRPRPPWFDQGHAAHAMGAQLTESSLQCTLFCCFSFFFSLLGFQDPATRQGLFAAAIRIAKHVGYTNAGTVEFLVDQSGIKD